MFKKRETSEKDSVEPIEKKISELKVNFRGKDKTLLLVYLYFYKALTGIMVFFSVVYILGFLSLKNTISNLMALALTALLLYILSVFRPRKYAIMDVLEEIEVGHEVDYEKEEKKEKEKETKTTNSGNSLLTQEVKQEILDYPKDILTGIYYLSYWEKYKNTESYYPVKKISLPENLNKTLFLTKDIEKDMVDEYNFKHMIKMLLDLDLGGEMTENSYFKTCVKNMEAFTEEDMTFIHDHYVFLGLTEEGKLEKHKLHHLTVAFRDGN